MSNQDPAKDEDGVKEPLDNKEEKVENNSSASGQDDNKTPSGEDDKKQEQMVPLSRFKEVIEEKNKYKEEIDKRNKADEKKKQKELEDQGKYQELLTEKEKELELANKSKDELAQHQEALQEILDQELEKIPEEKRSLIPDELSLIAKLKYIAKNRSVLSNAKDSTGAPIPPNSKNLSDFEAKKQRYNELMEKRSKGEFLSEQERKEIATLGHEIVIMKSKM